MSFIKHIGKHGDRKVCILFREVPQEDHMCLVIYPEVLPAHWHDSIMRVLESDVGQQAEEFSTALHRSLLPDGRLILETLHHERMIKKIRTADVLITPVPGSSIRLDELNKMLNEMKKGNEAIEKMAKNDASRGLVDPFTKRAAEAEYKKGREQTAQVQPITAAADGALSDRDIAANMLSQAQRMEAEAKGMVAEAARMKKEAEKLFPNVSSSKTSSKEVTETVVSGQDVPKVRRGRGPNKPKASKVADGTK
jgi:hypothetical protein